MEVFGLPLHPLMVHAAVVLVPLSSLGALLVVASGRVRDRYGWLVVGFAVAAAVAAYVAKLAGEALSDSLGVASLVVTHRMWGELVPYPTITLAIALPAALLVRGRWTWAWRLAAVVTVLAALAGLVLVVLTGDSGARVVWGSALHPR